jgi:type II secretory ATPase GspE/PulE/Tfp pilus assembly ATPase PilB-like protein
MKPATAPGKNSSNTTGRGADEHAGAADLGARLLFSRNMQHVATRIHAMATVDDILLDAGADIKRVFNAERLHIYVISDDGRLLHSKVRAADGTVSDFRRPIKTTTLVGVVAQNQVEVNLRDATDDEELAAVHADLHPGSAFGIEAGDAPQQVLVAPIIYRGKRGNSSEMLGVAQLINSRSGQPFGAGEIQGFRELCDTLAVAIRNRRKEAELALLSARPVRSKYDALVADGLISAEEMKLAANSARRKGVDVEEILLTEFQVDRRAIGKALATFFEVPYEPFKPERPKPLDLIKQIKREYAQSAQWVPLEDADEGLVVLTTDPERIQSSRVVSNIFPRASKVAYRVTTVEEFDRTLDLFFGEDFTAGSIGDFLRDAGNDSANLEFTETGDEAAAAADNELVKFVNKVIIDAHHQGASDIHIEPYPGRQKTVIRFRKDGSLSPYVEVPPSYRAPLVARIKIMCDLDTSEKRKPQDGKIKFKKYGPLDIELRVATIPSAGGVEDVVMRILSAGKPIPVDQLGLTPHNAGRLLPVISKPYGLFFVCGPTGSGKTTTLHSILGHLNTPENKIWTAEDPVEITQKGLRQVQVNRKAGLDFATVMKSFLRADPDIIMVGEMRDSETVAIGIEASLTGHLVFATLHTNSAPESITRLLDMGMDPFNFADALLGILAQRLAKKLCTCKEAYTPDSAEIRAFVNEYAEDLQTFPAWQADPKLEAKRLYDGWIAQYGVAGKLVFHRAKGCDRCAQTGYKGRVGLHELMIGSDAIKKNIQEHARVADLFVTAIGEGMRTLRMDGMEKVLSGVTDLKQVRAVCVR